MKVYRTTVTAIGIITFIWFLLPLCLSVNLNIGNLTGLCVSAGLVGYGIFMPQIHRLLRSWKLDSKKKWLFRGVIGMLGAVVMLVLIESACMMTAACKEPEADATVVVLGCRVYGERPSLSMKERLEAAYDHLEKYPDAVCILSGGQGVGENISEAECMYRWLAEKGINPGRLYKEEAAESTRENLMFSKELIEREGLNPKMAITTSEYHQYRAGRIARSLDINWGAVPARTAIWLFPTFYVRELYGILYEWIF